MSQTISKWGHSLALRIPKAFVEQLDWDAGTEVICSIVDGKLAVQRVEEPMYDLDELIAGITPENRHEETDFGSSVDNEVW